MIATLKGRLQTKIIAWAIMAAASPIFVYAYDCTIFYTMVALAIVISLILETSYSFFIDYEPGWLTILFGVIEFTLIFAALRLLQLDIVLSQSVAKLHEGLIFYLATWSLTQLFLIYLLPVWRPSWLEEGSELW